MTVPVVHTEPLEGFRVLEALSGNPTAELRAAILNLDIPDEPVVVKRRYEERSLETLAVKGAADLGPLLLDGLADGIWIDAPGFAESEIRDIELMILQAARVRFSHTEYIACPSCGRTLYDIEKALADIKARTSHLKNLRIGVMGCIVNGPGEMADADYGYGLPGIALFRSLPLLVRAFLSAGIRFSGRLRPRTDGDAAPKTECAEPPSLFGPIRRSRSRRPRSAAQTKRGPGVSCRALFPGLFPTGCLSRLICQSQTCCLLRVPTRRSY